MTGSSAFAPGAARARTLAAMDSPVRDLLAFYAEVLDYQRTLADGARPAAGGDRPFADTVDVHAAAAAVPAFLTWLDTHARPSFRPSAAVLRSASPATWREWMRHRLTDANDADASADPARQFVIDVLLQPFAERAAQARPAPRDGGTQCPRCDDAPAVGLLREEGQGGRRSLVCGLCLTEWAFPRVACPSCGERRFDALPVFTSEQHPHARIDACDTCHHYQKTIDLTKNGLAVPLVDDLASLPLDLWAREHGYTRSRPHLLCG